MKSKVTFTNEGKAIIELTVSKDELWLIDSCLKRATSTVKHTRNIMISKMIEQTSAMIEDELWGSH